MLDALEEQMPSLLRENPDDADFWSAFAGLADEIEEFVGPYDAEYVRGRIDCILGAQGLIPSDNEGETCGDAPVP